MKKILLVDYCGHHMDMKPIGHSMKALEEYRTLLTEYFDIDIAAPRSIINNIETSNYEKIISLPYSIGVEETSWFNYKIQKIEKLLNLFYVYRILGKEKYSFIWFYNVDFTLFEFIYIFKNKNISKFICTIYKNNFASKKHEKFDNYIFGKVIKKIYMVVHTTRSFPADCNALFIPDYLYKQEYYSDFLKVSKSEKAVLLGTIDNKKNIEAVVESFAANGYRLEVIGKFRDKKRYMDLHNKQYGDNIKISDTYLPDKEYYKTLAEAKFAILPYDIKEYYMRTSGILQECVFLDVVPVCHEEILESNGIKGLNIHSIKDVKNMDFEHINISDILDANRNLREQVYNYDVNKRKLLEKLNVFNA